MLKIITTFKNIDEDLNITLTGLSVYHVHYRSNLVVTCNSYRFILLIILGMLVQMLFHYHNMRPLITLSLTWIKMIVFVNLDIKITQETITTEKVVHFLRSRHILEPLGWNIWSLFSDPVTYLVRT